MQSTIQQSVTVTLVLSKEEADWLHVVMQNPLHNHSPATEPLKDAEMRRKFFLATQQ